MKELIQRLEDQAIEISELKSEIENMKISISSKENELLLIQSASQIAKATYEKRIDKLQLDLREARNAAKTAIYRYYREVPKPVTTDTKPVTILTPYKNDVSKYSGLGPAVPREQWDEIIERIVKDTSVPESERFAIKQTQRLRQALGVSRPSARDAFIMVKEARKKFGMPENGPSYPDHKPTLLLPPPKEDSPPGFLEPTCFGC